MDDFEIIKETDVVCPSIISLGEVALMVVKYLDDNTYGIEANEDLCPCTSEELLDALDEFDFLLTFPELNEISNARYEQESTAIEMAEKLIDILLEC